MTTSPHVARITAGLAGVALLSGCAANASEAPATHEPDFVNKGELTVCSDMPYEPFASKEKGQPVGFDVDLAKEVASSLDRTLTVLDIDFDAITSGDALNRGRCDLAVSAMTITADRARVVDFSSPYFNASQVLVTRGGSPITALAGAAGKRIGAQDETTGEVYLADHAPESTKVVTFADAGEMETALQNGRIDAAVLDNTIVDDVLTRHPDMTIAAQFDTGEQYGMAVKKDGNVDLLRQVNDVIAELQSNGRYDEIYTQWFGTTPLG